MWYLLQARFTEPTKWTRSWGYEYVDFGRRKYAEHGRNEGRSDG